jgi:hypothetical protein
MCRTASLERVLALTFLGAACVTVETEAGQACILARHA